MDQPQQDLLSFLTIVDQHTQQLHGFKLLIVVFDRVLVLVGLILDLEFFGYEEGLYVVDYLEVEVSFENCRQFAHEDLGGGFV